MPISWRALTDTGTRGRLHAETFTMLAMWRVRPRLLSRTQTVDAGSNRTMRPISRGGNRFPIYDRPPPGPLPPAVLFIPPRSDGYDPSLNRSDRGAIAA